VSAMRRTDAEGRRRLRDSLGALSRITGSARLDRRVSARSGVPIGFAAFAVLGRVVDDGPIRLSDLATSARMLPAALTRQVQALEAEGYIERRPDPLDGRAAVVEVTAAGRSAHASVNDANDGIMSEQLAEWSSDELWELVDRLERLIHDLRSAPEARAARDSEAG
jgi:DNA-binding MarR family transcriptional regulator